MTAECKTPMACWEYLAQCRDINGDMVGHGLAKSLCMDVLLWSSVVSDGTLSSEEYAQFMALLDKIKQMPIPYILGSWGFLDLTLKVTPMTLIPRSETELLVRCVLQQAQGKNWKRFLDLGTGSGAIGIALARHLPCVEGVLVDAQDVLAVASHNVQQYGLSDRVQCLCSHWYEKVEGAFDVIVSNPPYVASDEPINEGAKHEPECALFSGIQGLDDLAHIIQNAPSYLNQGGLLCCEHGMGQGDAVAHLFEKAQMSAYLLHDFQGHPRVTYGYLK